MRGMSDVLWRLLALILSSWFFLFVLIRSGVFLASWAEGRKDPSFWFPACFGPFLVCCLYVKGSSRGIAVRPVIYREGSLHLWCWLCHHRRPILAGANRFSLDPLRAWCLVCLYGLWREGRGPLIYRPCSHYGNTARTVELVQPSMMDYF